MAVTYERDFGSKFGRSVVRHYYIFKPKIFYNCNVASRDIIDVYRLFITSKVIFIIEGNVLASARARFAPQNATFRPKNLPFCVTSRFFLPTASRFLNVAIRDNAAFRNNAVSASSPPNSFTNASARALRTKRAPPGRLAAISLSPPCATAESNMGKRSSRASPIRKTLGRVILVMANPQFVASVSS